MTELFLRILNMSIAASWLVLAVLGIRLILRKAPKWVCVLLWGIVAIRLACPFSIESAFSLIPSAETIPENVLSGTGFQIQTGIAPVDGTMNNYLGSRDFENVTATAGSSVKVFSALSIVWLIGSLLLITYAAISYWRLQRKVDTAVLLRENIFQSELVDSPFVLGIIKPRIYIPFQLDDLNIEYVIAHEKTHIRRWDHWWKPLGFLLLAVHWFNPLIWIAYVLLCRDIELACDEKVIQKLNSEQRAEYTQTLILCSVNRGRITACPLAFGEIGVIERVRSVMNYKKPAAWAIVLAIIACGTLTVCFLTNPVESVSVEMNMPSKETTTSVIGFEKSNLSQQGKVEEQIQIVYEQIETLLIIIQASPSGIYGSEDHIEAHQAEFTELCSYGEYTLQYCFSELLSHGQFVLRSRIMACVCHEIAVQWGDELLMIATSDVDNDQWFDDFEAKAAFLFEKYSAEKFEQMYPAAWLYFQIKNA